MDNLFARYLIKSHIKVRCSMCLILLFRSRVPTLICAGDAGYPVVKSLLETVRSESLLRRPLSYGVFTEYMIDYLRGDSLNPPNPPGASAGGALLASSSSQSYFLFFSFPIIDRVHSQ